MKNKKINIKIVLSGLFTLALVVIIIVFGFFVKYRLPIKYEAEVSHYAATYQLDPYLVYAIIYCESGYDASVISHKGAVGLMQLMPSTAKWVAQKARIEYNNADDLKDPDKNINIGCYYLSYLMKRFDHNLNNVLAAYNGGEGNVRTWLGNRQYSSDGITLDNIPFEETKNYVQKVNHAYEQYTKQFKDK